MAKKIIELHNGRIKRTGNRIGGDTNSLETRHRRHDNEHRLHVIRRQHNLDARQAIEDCDMIGPRGIINKASADYLGQQPRREKQPRQRNRNRNRYNDSGRNDYGYHSSHFAASTLTTTVVTVKKSRPAFKVVIDNGGTMRAIPLN
ncbi:hypothetical protein BH11CYA1_BH11CYA1_07910 [soil metagenome]